MRALEDTHSTYLVQGGGSCWAMKTQLVRMVHMMSMLKSVAPALRKPREGYWQSTRGTHRESRGRISPANGHGKEHKKPWENSTQKATEGAPTESHGRGCTKP